MGICLVVSSQKFAHLLRTTRTLLWLRSLGEGCQSISYLVESSWMKLPQISVMLQDRRHCYLVTTVIKWLALTLLSSRLWMKMKSHKAPMEGQSMWKSIHSIIVIWSIRLQCHDIVIFTSGFMSMITEDMSSPSKDPKISTNSHHQPTAHRLWTHISVWVFVGSLLLSPTYRN